MPLVARDEWKRGPPPKRKGRGAAPSISITGVCALVARQACPIAVATMLEALLRPIEAGGPALASAWFVLHCGWSWLRQASLAKKSLPYFLYYPDGDSERDVKLGADGHSRYGRQRSRQSEDAQKVHRLLSKIRLEHALAAEQDAELDALLALLSLQLYPTAERYDHACATSMKVRGADAPTELSTLVSALVSMDWGGAGSGEDAEKAHGATDRLVDTITPLLPERVALALHTGFSDAAVALCMRTGQSAAVWRCPAEILELLWPCFLVLEGCATASPSALTTDFCGLVVTALISINWLKVTTRARCVDNDEGHHRYHPQGRSTDLPTSGDLQKLHMHAITLAPTTELGRAVRRTAAAEGTSIQHSLRPEAPHFTQPDTARLKALVHVG